MEGLPDDRPTACPMCGAALPGSPPSGDADADDPEKVVFRRPAEEDSGIDMTPMVDVVFQLLIFFMLTAAFAAQKSLEVPPPDPQKEAAQARTVQDILADDDTIVIRIDKDSTIWVEESEAPSKQELLAKLRETREGRGGEGTGPSNCVVMADGDARHEAVVTALDCANAVGMENVRLATVDDEDY